MDSMQVLRFTLPAGGQRRFEIGGRYLELVACPLSVDVDFTKAGGQQQGNRWTGALAGFYAKGDYSGLTISNPHAVDQALVLLMTDGEAGYRGIPNVLNATIDAAAVTERGRHFLGYTTVSSPDRALIDSSTGAGLAVHELHITAGVASEVTVFTAQNATGVTLATLLPPPPAGFQSMVAGAADSTVGRKRTASASTLTNRKDVAPLRAAANVTAIWRPAVPFVISGTNLVGVECNSGSVFVAAVVEEL